MDHKSEMKELGTGIIKAAIGAVPVGGSLLNELIFEVRGRVKQSRYNSFVDALGQYMNSQFQVPLSIEQIEEEQIGDFFEQVVVKVVRINAQKNIDALKRLLASQIISPENFDYAEVLADLISEMSPNELMIMQKITEDSGEYADHYAEYYKEHRELEMLHSRKRERKGDLEGSDDTWTYTQADSKLQQLVSEQEEKVKQLGELLESKRTAFEPGTYELDPWEFYFHLSQLVRKGIVLDESGGLGASALSVIKPNQVAFDILGFLNE
ncbi:MAG: hypothetical protein JST70_01775 [Bacteroidetes bacterium]|nr:hypothetical protein [Bacteroidota bacterium]